MEHETTTQDHDQQPIRRSSGRRKAKGGGGGGDAKKTKQPRRGMGVAKLERLREQGEIMPMNAYHHHLGQMGPSWNPVGFPGFYGLTGSDRRLLQNHHSDFLVKNSDENVVKCYSLHCNACHKKKKINRNVLNQDSPHNVGGAKPPQPLGNYGNKVEVVAVHRKGSSSSWEGGNNRVLMEYDFFPAAAKSGGTNDESELVGNSSTAGFDASNCVDLSLKLSY